MKCKTIYRVLSYSCKEKNLSLDGMGKVKAPRHDKTDIAMRISIYENN